MTEHPGAPAKTEPSGPASALAERGRAGTPANVALMHLIVQAEDRGAVAEALAQARPLVDPDWLDEVGRLWRANPGAWTAVRATLANAEHEARHASPEAALVFWRQAFDRLARSAPEAGVALYALGDPDLLAAATTEVVDRLRSWGLLGPEHDVVDLGCGIGRFAAALAPRVRSVLGLDLSDGMVAEARRRCAGLANVRVERSSGHDLAGVDTGSVDLLLAADVFPYLVEAGDAVLDAHWADLARVLRHGGHAVILNYSYRRDLEADRREVGDRAAAAGLAVLRAGSRDFALWDGAAFHLRAPSGHSRSAG